MRLPILFLGVLTFGYLTSGCGCCDDIDYQRVDSLSVVVHENDSSIYDALEDSAVTSTDTLFLQSKMDVAFVASTRTSNWLINSANATSCDYGSKGLKDRLAFIVFNSDQVYNGVPAGEAINAFVKGYGHNWDYATQTSTSVLLELPEVINQINDSPYGENFVFQKPAEPLYRRIRMTLVFASGRYLVSESPVFKWE